MTQQLQPQLGEHDRVGRILAREQRVAARVARHFDDPSSALAAEVRDILTHWPECYPEDRLIARYGEAVARSIHDEEVEYERKKYEEAHPEEAPDCNVTPPEDDPESSSVAPLAGEVDY